MEKGPTVSLECRVPGLHKSILQIGKLRPWKGLAHGPAGNEEIKALSPVLVADSKL